MTSLICLEGMREDAWSSEDAEPSEGGEREPGVDMGEGKKRDWGLQDLGIHIYAYNSGHLPSWGSRAG